jgi:hypothetical protein
MQLIYLGHIIGFLLSQIFFDEGNSCSVTKYVTTKLPRDTFFYDSLNDTVKEAFQ